MTEASGYEIHLIGGSPHVYNRATGSYTVHLPKDPRTGKFRSEPPESVGRIVIGGKDYWGRWSQIVKFIDGTRKARLLGKE